MKVGMKRFKAGEHSTEIEEGHKQKCVIDVATNCTKEQWMQKGKPVPKIVTDRK